MTELEELLRRIAREEAEAVVKLGRRRASSP
jgi:hypothetical protein